MSDDHSERNTIDQAVNIAREKSQPPKTRLDAILYIIDQFDSKFFPLLEEIVNDETEHPEVRSAAALALGKIGGDRALETLLNHTHTSDPTLKNNTMHALAMLGREECIPPLIEALKDKNNVIFATAAEALGKFGRPVIPYLIDLLEAGADDARCIAAWQLGELRYMDAVPALTRRVKEERNPDVTALSIWALGEIGYGPTEVVSTLEWAAHHENPAIHLRASRALKKISRHVN